MKICTLPSPGKHADPVNFPFTAHIYFRGDVRALRALCCDGLATKLVNQVERRPPNQKVSWSRVSWLRQPDTLFRGIRILSDRATAIPEIPNSGIRQIV